MIHVYHWTKTGVTTHGSDFSGGVPTDPGVWAWVDLIGEDPDVIRAVGSEFDLDFNTVEESIAETALPLVEEHLNEVFVVLHGFTVEGGRQLETPEIDVFIGERFLVTVRDKPLPGIEQAKDRLALEGGLPVNSPAGLIAFLARLEGRRYGSLIPELERQVDRLEEMAFQGDPRTASEGHALRRDVILLRRALGPQFDAIEDLSESTHPAIDDEARLMFARVASQYRRALESLEAGRALLGTIMETYRGAVADQTNEIMRVLTVFSAILLPLTLIAGLWGMNFVDIPGAHQPEGFWLLLGIMALLAAGVWIYFARRGFIGAPRLKDLPRAVGLGLFNIGTSPIRAVTGSRRQRGQPGAEDS